MGKECLEEKKHLYLFKGIVPIGPLGMVDDLLTISECGYKTNLMNQYINFKTGTKRLQFGTSKCIKMHIGKQNSDTLCKDVYVSEWKEEVVTDSNTGKCRKSEYFNGNVKMEKKQNCCTENKKLIRHGLFRINPNRKISQRMLNFFEIGSS